MDIIIEGPDNAGKSTLAGLVKLVTGRVVIPSEGPEKYPGEVEERVARYQADYRDVIYDRHPCISQNIYSVVKPCVLLEESVIEKFYKTRPLLIYCRPLERGLEGHVVKDHDSPEFLQSLETNYDKVVAEYDKWGLRRAAIIYRIGDDTARVLNFIKGVVDYV